MEGRAQVAAEYVKSGFSVTESYLFRLKGMTSAVLEVLKRSFKERRLFPARLLEPSGEGGDASGESGHNESNRPLQTSVSTSNIDGIAHPGCADTRFCSYCSESICYVFSTCAELSTKTCKIVPKLECHFFTSSVGISGQSNTSFWCCTKLKYFLSVITFGLPVLLVFYLFWAYYDGYIQKLLTSFEEMDSKLAFAIFVLLFMTASLPLVWGYVVLNLAAGYRFGVLTGAFVVMVSVTVGLSLTHKVSQRLCAGCIKKSLKWYGKADLIDGILKVLDGPSGLKVIALTRLTPIPFGLQNGIFAMSNVQTKYYVAASNVGLFPTQLLNCYIGSTFRSAGEAITQGGSIGGYIVFIFQLAIGIALMGFVIKHARKELDNALKYSTDKAEWADGVDGIAEDMLTEIRVTQPVSTKSDLTYS